MQLIYPDIKVHLQTQTLVFITDKFRYSLGSLFSVCQNVYRIGPGGRGGHRLCKVVGVYHGHPSRHKHRERKMKILRAF